MKSKKQLGKNPGAPGDQILERFREDHRKDRSVDEGELFPVVAFADDKRHATLLIAEVGGFLWIYDGKKVKRCRVFDALAWFRRNLARNWFTQRVDFDTGWLLLLGMAEGLTKEKFQEGGAR